MRKSSLMGLMLGSVLALATLGTATAAETRGDALRRADARFSRMDTNRDGVVSPAERRAFQQRRAAVQSRHYRPHAKRFHPWDLNRDGVVSHYERRVARRGYR